MLNKNNYATGTLAGSILPALSLFIFFYLLKGNFLIFDKPGVPYLVAICFNLFLIRYCFKKQLDKTGAAMVVVTFIFMVIVFVFKLQPLS